MSQRHGPAGFRKRRAKLEARVVGKKRAGRDGGRAGALSLHNHARARAHDIVGRFFQKSPAGFGDLRRGGARPHFGKEKQRPLVVAVDPDPALRKKRRKASPQLIFTVAAQVPGGNLEFDAGAPEPGQPFDSMSECALASFAS